MYTAHTYNSKQYTVYTVQPHSLPDSYKYFVENMHQSNHIKRLLHLIFMSCAVQRKHSLKCPSL